MKKVIVIGIDIGGTKTAVSLGNTDGDIIDKVKFPTQGTWQQVFDKIIAIIGTYKKEYTVDAVGISCGGPLDSKAGKIQSPPNLPGWDDVPICQLISEKTHIPCFLENDANACALAEWTWGAGRGTRNMIFLTFGTGLGAGLILDGKLYSGTSGLAGEVGHIRLAENGPIGYGKEGSWEGFCSGGGLSAQYRNLFGEDKSGKSICKSANNGDKKALTIINTSAEYLGRGIAILADIINPEKIIIGSIFSRDEQLFREKMEEAITRESLPQTAQDCSVVTAELDENLGDMAALGVALNGLKHHAQNLNEYAKPLLIKNKEFNNAFLEDLTHRYPALSSSLPDIENAIRLLIEVVTGNGKIMICGNGGSSADADHIVGELMKSFILPRPLPDERVAALEQLAGQRGKEIGESLQQGINAFSLSSPTALNTAFLNDVKPDLVFAQQVSVAGNTGDLLLCLSTSGNSKNIVAAVITAKAKGMKTIAMTGSQASELSQLCDVTIRVNEQETYKIQELHLPIYHVICLILEDYFFS
jgi:glucokinase